MDKPLVVCEVSDGVAFLTLNHPEKRNALSRAMLTALREQLARIAADDGARVVILEDGMSSLWDAVEGKHLPLKPLARGGPAQPLEDGERRLVVVPNTSPASNGANPGPYIWQSDRDLREWRRAADVDQLSVGGRWYRMAEEYLLAAGRLRLALTLLEPERDDRGHRQWVSLGAPGRDRLRLAHALSYYLSWEDPNAGSRLIFWSAAFQRRFLW